MINTENMVVLTTFLVHTEKVSAITRIVQLFELISIFFNDFGFIKENNIV